MDNAAGQDTDTKVRLPSIKRIVALVLPVTGYGSLLFLAAGTLDWWQAWAYLCLQLVILTAMLLLMVTKNPELIPARSKRHADTKKFDRILLSIYVPLPIVMLVVAGLDKRFEWGSLPQAWSPVGLILLVLGTLPSAWAISLNPHFEATVRIQEDRGHRVISTGPYRYVRHPGYLSVILTSAATPLLLGTPWAYLPVGAIFVVIVIRTALEDSVLRRELSGYQEYARRVRRRLFPGIW